MAVSVTTTMLARKMFAPRSAVKDSSSALPSPIYLTFHPLLTTEVGMTPIYKVHSYRHLGHSPQR